MTVLDGFPRSVIEAKDASVLPTTLKKGIYIAQIATLRGTPNKPFYCGTWQDFVKEFGSYIDGKRGTFTLKKLLDRGGKCWVSRAGHYTDVSDTSTLQGTKSTGSLTVAVVAETKATSNLAITVPGADGDIIPIVVNNGVSVITIGSYTVQYDDDASDVAAGLRTAVNALTGTYGYTAAGTTNNVHVTAPTGSGAAANNYILGINPTGAVFGNITQFSGGISAVISSQAGTSNWEAKNIGNGYDGITIDVTLNKLDATKVDVTVTVPGGQKTPQVQKGINRVPSGTDITNLSGLLKDVNLLSMTTRLPIGRVTLAGGVYDATALTDTDYTGSSTAKTGLFSFGTVLNASRIANLERNTPVVDALYVAYVESRVFMRSIMTFPEGLDFDTANAYRTGEAPYNHSPIDSFRGSYIYGDVIYYDPRDVNKDMILSGIGDVCGLRAKVDSKQGEWISHAGYPNGVIDQNKGVVLNLGNPDDLDKAGILYENGINAVIVHETFGTVYWGNRSLLRDQSKITSKENVAELMIFIMRNLKIFSDKGLFKPNDPTSWSALYREAKQFILGLEDSEAIVKGEGTAWAWIGDQNADVLTDATFNDLGELSAGKYRARFVFLPISATEYIGIEAVASDAGSLQFAITTQTNL